MRKWFVLAVLVMLAGCSAPAASNAVKVSVAGGSYISVAPAMLKQMLAAKDFIFINVHIPYEGEIAQTDSFIPYDRIAESIAKFPADKNAKIFLYCRSGRMSAMAAEELVVHGSTCGVSTAAHLHRTACVAVQV